MIPATTFFELLFVFENSEAEPLEPALDELYDFSINNAYFMPTLDLKLNLGVSPILLLLFDPLLCLSFFLGLLG